MALPVYLSDLKSSGVYTFEFDKSETISTNTTVTRLLIGFSKTGPFNTPVFCRDYKFFESVYGKRDKTLEKKGSYFHLNAEEMLSVSPIIALNLLSLDNELDKTDFISLSTSATEQNQRLGKAPLSGYYNTNKFWKLETDKMLNNIDYQEGYSKSLLNFANIGRKSISVIVTQGKIQGLDITANEWYGSQDVPEFMDGSDFINDYCVRVDVIKGDYTDFGKLSSDTVLGGYFDSNGIKKVFVDSNGNKKDGLTAFLQDPNVISLGSYVGVLIPNFVDKDNQQLYIQDIINLDTPFTGLYCAINEDLFDGSQMLSGNKIDLLGGSIEGESTLTKINYLSYLGTVSENLSYDENVPNYGSLTTSEQYVFVGNTANNYTNVGFVGFANAQFVLTDISAYNTPDKFDTLVVYSPESTDTFATPVNAFNNSSEWLEFAQSIVPNVSYVACTSENGNFTYALVKNVAILSDKVYIQIFTKDKTGEEELYFDGTLLNLTSGTQLDLVSNFNIQSLNAGKYLFTKTSDAGKDFDSGILSSGDTVQVQGGAYENFSIVSKVGNGDSDELTLLLGSVLSHGITYYILTPETTPVNSSTMMIKSVAGSINKVFTVTKINDYEFSYSVSSASPYKLGDIKPTDFLVRSFTDGTTKTNIDARTGKSRYTRIESVKHDVLTNTVTVKTIEPVYFGITNDVVERYKSVDNFVTNYNVHGLNGFVLRDAQIPDGTSQRQSEILGTLLNTGLYSTLADRDSISFRYIVDSFDGTIEPNTKKLLSSLSKERMFSFSILNAPSVKQFDNSVNPLFKFNSRSNFDPSYIASGGNQDMNPSNTFSLPTINQGSNYCGFYHPYLTLRDGNSTKIVPPAGYVSNNYIAKYRNYKPYSIVAGSKRGVVAGSNIVGVEYIYDKQGLDAVEPFGLNVIVPSRTAGLIINANKTAQQNIKSSLSSIHVRELLIYIEEIVEQILKSYQWELNTVQSRLEIKTLVDGFLSNIQNDGGLYDFTTVMNSTNNTNEIIENNIGIIDIGIEPARGLEKVVNRITILKKGTIASGGFTIQ